MQYKDKKNSLKEKILQGVLGGDGGIRTHGTVRYN